MQATETDQRYADRRGRVRVVNRRNYTVECKLCGARWQPVLNANGRVVRWGLRCPNPKCKYHDD
jgi:hypothetical protein